jgi:hypothetical protein
LVAPVNNMSKNEGRAMGYVPDEKSSMSERCYSKDSVAYKYWSVALAPVITKLTTMGPATASNPTTVGDTVYLRELVQWQWLEKSAWYFGRRYEPGWESWWGGGYAEIHNLSGIAVGEFFDDGTFHDNEKTYRCGKTWLWLSGDGFQQVRVAIGTEGKVPSQMVLGKHWRTSPAAVDSAGRAYVVVHTGTDSYELWRFGKDVLQGDERTCLVGSLCANGQLCLGIGSQARGTTGACQSAPERRALAMGEAPVGSPILGEPVGKNPAEVYVVTTAGPVLAYRADTLKLLWTQNLDIHVAPTAQPVLTGNMLWVAGIGEAVNQRLTGSLATGEVRGVQVDSNGLSRSALWPKAFRDNCNTSNAFSSPSIWPSCFE